MTTHSTLSPSSAYRWLNCPGSVREQAKYPEQPSGLGAIDGTHSHTLLEHCVRNDLIDPFIMVGIRMSDHEGEFVVDRERAKRVKVAIDYVREKVDALQMMFGQQATVIAERKVNPAHLIGRDDMAGTCDITIICGAFCEIIDFKDGMNTVEAKDNEQLELYALGTLADYKLPVNVAYPVNTVRMTIVQPKLALKGLDAISSHTMSTEEVLALIPKYVIGGSAVDKPDAPLVPGEKQCRYCRATGCSARNTAAMAMAGVTFSAVQPSQQVAAQDPGSMTNERLREVIEAAPLMRQMIEAAEAEAQRRLEAGQAIPGLKLVNGRGSQAWAIPEDQVVEKLKTMGVPKDAIYKTSVVSPAQAKKLTWEKRDGTKKTLSERQLKTLETEYIVKLGGKLTVATESDPRPAVVRDASPMFSAVQVEPAAPALPAWLS